jgi:hypothetical protein
VIPSGSLPCGEGGGRGKKAEPPFGEKNENDKKIPKTTAVLLSSLLT